MDIITGNHLDIIKSSKLTLVPNICKIAIKFNKEKEEILFFCVPKTLHNLMLNREFVLSWSYF